MSSSGRRRKRTARAGRKSELHSYTHYVASSPSRWVARRDHVRDHGGCPLSPRGPSLNCGFDSPHTRLLYCTVRDPVCLRGGLAALQDVARGRAGTALSQLDCLITPCPKKDMARNITYQRRTRSKHRPNARSQHHAQGTPWYSRSESSQLVPAICTGCTAVAPSSHRETMDGRAGRRTRRPPDRALKAAPRAPMARRARPPSARARHMRGPRRA